MRSSASVRLTWPSMQFAHVGEFESSKSAMNIFAPELRALITIFRSTGPVISTRRSCSSAGTGATRQSLPRTSFVSGRKSGSSPSRSSSARSCLAASSSRRRGPNRRSSSVRNATASGVSTCSSMRGLYGVTTSSPSAATSASRVSRPSGQRTTSSLTVVAAPRPNWTRGSSEER